jgi:hypothetical protein
VKRGMPLRDKVGLPGNPQAIRFQMWKHGGYRIGIGGRAGGIASIRRGAWACFLRRGRCRAQNAQYGEEYANKPAVECQNALPHSSLPLFLWQQSKLTILN